MAQTIIKETLSDDLTAHLAMMEAYDETYEIYDHSTSDDLTSVVFMHPAENPIKGGKLDAYLTEMITLKIPELLNGELLDILDKYPLWYIDNLLGKVRTIREAEAKKLADLEGNQGKG